MEIESALENAHDTIKRSFDEVEKSLSIVGGYISQALQEEATSLGGDDLAIHVANIAQADTGFLSPYALEFLKEIAPGSELRVMQRAHEIQNETEQREMAEAPKRGRRIGRQLLIGAANAFSFGLPIGQQGSKRT